MKFVVGGGKLQAPSNHCTWAVPWALLQGRCAPTEVRTPGRLWTRGPAACQAVVGSLGVWIDFWTTYCFVRDETLSAVSPLGCLHGEDVRIGPLCCHLCSGCYHSPALVASMAWRGPHCSTVVPSSSPTSLHPCCLPLRRMCWLETSMICFVFIWRKTQLCPWGGQASPRPVHPMQSQRQISSSAPCWVPVAPVPSPLQLAPTLRRGSSTHCVGRSRENPTGRSLPWDVEPKKPPAPFHHFLSQLRLPTSYIQGPGSRVWPFLSPWSNTQLHSFGTGRSSAEARPSKHGTLLDGVGCMLSESRFSASLSWSQGMASQSSWGGSSVVPGATQLPGFPGVVTCSFLPREGHRTCTVTSKVRAHRAGGITTYRICSLKDLITATSNYKASLGPFEMKMLAFATCFHNWFCLSV